MRFTTKTRGCYAKFQPSLHEGVDGRTNDFVRIKISWMQIFGCIDNEFFFTNGTPPKPREARGRTTMVLYHKRQPTQLCPTSCSRLSLLLAARDVLLTARSGDRLLYSQADNFNKAVCSNSISFQGRARL